VHKKGTAGKHQIHSGFEEFFINQEVFLFSPTVVMTLVQVVLQKSLSSLTACLERASMERSKGVFLSKDSPV
jgi:hypothetical protein